MNELTTYLNMLKRGWWIVAITALSALIIALAASLMTEPVYRTRAQYIVSPNVALIDERDLFRSLDTLDRRSVILTYAEVFSSERMFEMAAASGQFVETDLHGYKVTAVVLPETNVLEAAITGPDPEIAASLLNAVGQQAVAYIRGLYQIYDVNLLDVAEAPSRPISPNPLKDAGVAVVLGLFVGGVLAIGYDYAMNNHLWDKLLGKLEAAEKSAV